MGMASIFKVMEYKPKHGAGIGPPPEGKLIKQFSGKKAADKANALRDKLNKNAKNGMFYFVKGDLGITVPSRLSINL